MSHDPLAALGDAPDIESTEPMAASTEAVSAPEAPAMGGGEVGATDAEAEPSDSANVAARGSTPTLLVLEESLTIAETAALQEAILEYVRTMSPLTLDASEVEMVDAAGLQLVASAFKTATSKGIAFRIERPSSRFVDAARQIGLGALLGVDGATTSA